MTYVPIVIPPDPAPPASPRARQLSVELDRVIEDFQKNYPDTKPGDVRDAMRLASRAVNAPSEAQARRLVVALLGGIMLLGGLVAYFMASRDPGAAPIEIPWLVVSIGVLAVLGVGVALFRRD